MPTINEVLTVFLDDCRAAGRSPATVRTYVSIVRAFSGHCRQPLHQVTAADVRAYMLELRARSAYSGAPQKPDQHRRLSAHTVAAHDRHLRGFLAWCVDAGYLDRSPMQGMKQPRLPKLKPKALTAGQFVAVLQAAQNYPDPVQAARNVALVAMLADTGARIGELLSLTVDTLDLEKQRAWVYSKGAEREIFFTHFTRQLVRQWMDVRDSVSKFLFTSVTTGEPLTGSGADQMLKRLRRAAGVRGKVSAHRFRHGFAVEFVKAGGDVSVLARLLGHNSISTTAGFYAVFSGDELKQLHDQVNPLGKMLRG